MNTQTQARPPVRKRLPPLSPQVPFADPATLAKAERFIERFREIVSDPLNLLIERVPQAGFVDSAGYVFLHNGNRADLTGRYAYYRDFSAILVINRGVHEPLEEFCFQELLKRIARDAPVMLELGSYWAHYSMWMKRAFPAARCVMVEPDPHNAAAGRNNFVANGYDGQFILDLVGDQRFGVDRFMARNGTAHLDLLHADIQGAEVEMLRGAADALARRAIDYIFISTHSDPLHEGVTGLLREHGYRVEVSSDFLTHTTSYDGFVMASSPDVAPVFEGLTPLGRKDIARASARELLATVTAIDAERA